MENGQFVPVVGIFRVGSVVQSRKKANGFEQKYEKHTAYRPRHYTSSLSESKAKDLSLPIAASPLLFIIFVPTACDFCTP